MRYVESRINSMVDIWGFEAHEVNIDHTHAKEHDTRPDKHLLNGPALAGEGVEQDDVDALLNQDGADLEANQDDVDALFDHDGGTDDDLIDTDDFEAVAVDADDAVAEDEVEASAADEVAVEEADTVAVDDDYMDLSDLDWAEGQADAESAEADVTETEAATAAGEAGEAVGDEQERAADVFASAEADEADAHKTAEEIVAEIDADIFAYAAESEDADVFAKASQPSEDAEEAASEEAELVDRVAQFS